MLIDLGFQLVACHYFNACDISVKGYDLCDYFVKIMLNFCAISPGLNIAGTGIFQMNIFTLNEYGIIISVDPCIVHSDCMFGLGKTYGSGNYMSSFSACYSSLSVM